MERNYVLWPRQKRKNETWRIKCATFIEPRYTNTNKVLWFKSEDERKNCFNYLTSKFMKMYAHFIRVNQRIPWQFVPYLDFSHPWTDEMLYDYFGLTAEEIKTIENEIN